MQNYLKQSRFRIAGFIARIGIPAPHMDTPSPDTPQSLLHTSQQNLQLDIEEKAGLGTLKEILVTKPSDYRLLKPNEFKHLKEKLSLFPFLPKAPALAEFAFLLQKKGGPLLKEQFEDQWQAATLNYAAAAEVFTALAELAEDQKADIATALQAASTNLLTASNVFARALSTYKSIAIRQANRSAQRPGQERETILSTEDAKAIQASLDTEAKLQKTVNPKPVPFFKRFAR